MARSRNLFILCAIALALFTSAAAHASDSPFPISSKHRGDGTLTLFRPVKNDLKTFKYRDEDGSYDEGVLGQISYYFRCRLTDETHPIDPNLIEILDAIEDHFGKREVRLISAYRSPERNTLMRKSGKRIANNSLHMEGRAADIEVQGISPKLLRDFVYVLKQGGVGYYRGRPFIHVDTGPSRTWGWKPPRTRRDSPAMANK